MSLPALQPKYISWRVPLSISQKTLSWKALLDDHVLALECGLFIFSSSKCSPKLNKMEL